MSDMAEQDRIEENLRHTRSRMDQRLNELQDKIAPGQVVEDILDYVRGNGGGEFGRNLLAAVQANPVPAVVAGIGIAWLMASNNRPASAAPEPARYSGTTYRPYSSVGGDDLQQRMRDAEGGVQWDDSDTDQSYSEKLDAARAGAMGLARHAQETASGFAERVRTAMSGGMEAAGRTTHDLRDSAAGVAGQAGAMAGQAAGQMAGAAGQLRDSARQVGGQVMQGAQAARQSGGDVLGSITGNPLALGAIGLATGALLAMMLPQTDQEDEAFGDIATQTRVAARDAAQAVVNQGADVAQKVVGAAKDSAAAHGFTGDKSVQDVVGAAQSGDLIQNAKQVAQDVLNAGAKAAQPRKDDEAPAQA